ncbi:hypothetical protein V9Z67_09185 [Streptococcus suis]|uniref:hypothetical protein n=1 Tax=Streptococcus suis TaxID=1307 RepID=UPI00300F8EFF
MVTEIRVGTSEGSLSFRDAVLNHSGDVKIYLEPGHYEFDNGFILRSNYEFIAEGDELGSVVFQGTFRIENKANLILRNILLAGDFKNNIIHVTSGCSLTLDNCEIHRTELVQDYPDYPNSTYYPLVYVDGGTATLEQTNLFDDYFKYPIKVHNNGMIHLNQSNLDALYLINQSQAEVIDSTIYRILSVEGQSTLQASGFLSIFQEDNRWVGLLATGQSNIQIEHLHCGSHYQLVAKIFDSQLQVNELELQEEQTFLINRTETSGVYANFETVQWGILPPTQPVVKETLPPQAKKPAIEGELVEIDVRPINQYERTELMDVFVFLEHHLANVQALRNRNQEIRNWYANQIEIAGTETFSEKVGSGITTATLIISAILFISNFFTGVGAFGFIVSIIFLSVVTYVVVEYVAPIISSIVRAIDPTKGARENEMNRLRDELNQSAEIAANNREISNILNENAYQFYIKKIPESFQNLNDIVGIWVLLRDLRADNFKEAANLVREEQFRNKMLSSLNIFQQQLASISVQLDEVNENITELNRLNKAQLAMLAKVDASISAGNHLAKENNRIAEERNRLLEQGITLKW